MHMLDGFQAELRKRYPSAFELLECLKHAGDNLEEDAFIQQVTFSNRLPSVRICYKVGRLSDMSFDMAISRLYIFLSIQLYPLVFIISYLHN